MAVSEYQLRTEGFCERKFYSPDAFIDRN